MISPRLQIHWKIIVIGLIAGVLLFLGWDFCVRSAIHFLNELNIVNQGRGVTMDPNKINPTDLTQLKTWVAGESSRYLPGSIGFVTDFKCAQDWMDAQTPEIQEQYIRRINLFFYKRRLPTHSLSVVKKALIYSRELMEVTRYANFDILDPAHSEFIYKILKKK